MVLRKEPESFALMIQVMQCLSDVCTAMYAYNWVVCKFDEYFKTYDCNNGSEIASSNAYERY